MYTLIVIIILIILVLVCRTLYVFFKDKINFFINGIDSGFAIPDIIMLWKVATICELEEPTSLFYSMPSLSKCMSMITNQSAAEGEEHSPKTQKLLTKLFDYRTKLQNKSDDKKGVSTTKSLEKGQPLRIIFPGKGVFASTVLNNGSTLAISVPKQKKLIPIPAEEWVGRVISVYFWRKGDARYVFDTTVLQNGLFVGESALFLKHTAELLRTQKRKSVRASCTIPGSIFIMKNNVPIDYSAVETRNGYRCMLLDVSESGALIKVGGKGVENIKLKLQFLLNNKLILMFGVIRTVEYHEEKNISLLHFECTHIEPIMRNEILSFVYKTIPDSEKEILEALEQTDIDAEVEAKKNPTMNEKLDGVDSASEDRINNIKNPNLIDKDIVVPGLGINGDSDKPKKPEDFSADDIEELEEFEELEEVE